MYKGKYLSGLISPSELVRMPAGTSLIYVVEPGFDFYRAMRVVTPKAAAAKAKIAQRGLSLIDSKHGHRLAIEMTVLEAASKVKGSPPGRPPIERHLSYRKPTGPRRQPRFEDVVHPSFEED